MPHSARLRFRIEKERESNIDLIYMRVLSIEGIYKMWEFFLKISKKLLTKISHTYGEMFHRHKWAPELGKNKCCSSLLDCGSGRGRGFLGGTAVGYWSNNTTPALAVSKIVEKTPWTPYNFFPSTLVSMESTTFGNLFRPYQSSLANWLYLSSILKVQTIWPIFSPNLPSLMTNVPQH